MKLLYIAQYFSFPENTSGTRAYDLATSFTRKGIEVIVLTGYSGANNEPKWNEFTREGIKFYRLNCPYNNNMGFKDRIKSFFYFLVEASKKALKIECDMVLATSTPLTIGVPALVMHFFKKKPYVFEVRDVWPEVPIAMGYFKNKIIQKILYRFEKTIYKHASVIVSLSSGMDSNIKQRYPNNKSVVIPNISEIERFKTIKKEIDIGVSENKKVLLYAGAFGNVNGLNYVMELAAKTVKYDPNVLYYLVGNGKEKNSNIELAKELGVLDKNVFVFDPVKKTDLPYLYSITTVGSSFVIDIPALWNNSANKFFDTLAAGHPVVINHEGWQADTIRKYNCGYVLPPKITEEAAKRFVEYMNNEVLIITQRKNSLKLAKEQFALDVAVERYMKIFKSIKY